MVTEPSGVLIQNKVLDKYKSKAWQVCTTNFSLRNQKIKDSTTVNGPSIRKL